MTDLIRIKTRWSGFNGGPGYSVMHFRGFGETEGGGGDVDQPAAEAAVAKVRQFFVGMRTMFPEEVRFEVEGEVDVVEDSSGQLVNSFSVAGSGILSGSAPGNYSAAAGGIINWRTAGVRAGRKVRGRTFLVPLAATAFGTDGELSDGSITAIRGQVDAMLSNANGPMIGVYARPTAKGANDGVWFRATSATIPPTGAILRSRRD